MARITAGTGRIEALRARFRGELVSPGDGSYNEVRKIWNGAIDKRPSLIARCAGAADVVEAVRWAREGELEIAVRGGGHGVSGNALTDGGVVIDCSQMTAIDVDPHRRGARVDPGVLLGDLCRATQRYGLAVPSGIISRTGVAGLTLGGGIGWLMRKHGLSCDNLLAADLVTAEGETLRVSADEHPELLWGLRGGGGNFGIVTSFEFACHPVGPTVLAGPVLWAAEDSADLLPVYREFAHDEPDELTTISMLRNAPPAPWVPEELRGRPVVMVGFCYAGAVEAGAGAIEPLRRWGRPLLDAVAPRDLTEYHHMFDGSVPHGLGYYWKSHYLHDLTGQAIGAFVDRAWAMQSKKSYTIMFHMGGAVRSIPAEHSAFEDRRAEFSPNINAVWEDLSAPLDIDWTRGLFNALAPASTGKAYVNFMSHDEQGRVADAYGEEKLERLVSLKNRFDPDNVFRLNQNIAPSRPR
ncbi:MAG: FAD-binding oxidoreductase [Actinomycetota bacterium]